MKTPFRCTSILALMLASTPSIAANPLLGKSDGGTGTALGVGGTTFTATGGQNADSAANRLTFSGIRMDLRADFGAVCDGSTNDLPALVKAINYANAAGVPVTVLVPGVCSIASLSSLTISGALTFEGIGGGKFKFAPGLTLPTIWLYFTGTTYATAFRNLAIDVNDAFVTTGIRSIVSYATGASFVWSNSSIINAGSIPTGISAGLLLIGGAGVTNCSISNSVFSYTSASNQKSSAINLGGNGANQAMHCSISKNKLVNGNFYYQGDYLDIGDNEVYGFGAGAGIVAEDGPEIDSSENYPHHILIHNNNVHDSQPNQDWTGNIVSGIEVGFPGTVVSNNTISNTASLSVKVYGDAIQVTGNHAKNAGTFNSSDFYNSCFATVATSVFSGSNSFFSENTCTDDGGGNTSYGYSQAANITGVSFGVNKFIGSKGAYNGRGTINFLSPQVDNRIINPCGAINQRNGVGGTNFNGIGPDQWRNVDAALTIFTSTFATAMFQCSTSIHVMSSTQKTPAAGDINSVYQNISVADTRDINFGATAYAQSIVVAFSFKSSISPFTGSMFVQNFPGNTTYAKPFVYTSAAGTPQNFSYVIPADTNSVGAVLSNIGLRVGFDTGSGLTQLTSSPGSWQTGIFYGVTGGTSLVTQANASTFDFSDVRLLPASSDQGWMRRAWSSELVDAQRFYRMSFPLSVVPAQNAGVAGAICAIAPIANSQPSAYLPFSPPMNAASPTVTLYNPSAANTNWRNITAVADGPASSVVSKDGSGILIDGVSAIATGGQQVCIHYTADGGL